MRFYRSLWLVFVLGSSFAQNVGIGTATPAVRLHVHGNPGTLVRVSANMPAGDAAQGLIGYQWFNVAGGNWAAYLADPDGGFGVMARSWELWEYPQNTGTGGCCRPRFRVHSSDGLGNPGEVVIGPTGNLGVGTLAPAAKVHIVGGGLWAQPDDNTKWAVVSPDGALEVFRGASASPAPQVAGYVDFKDNAADDYDARIYYHSTLNAFILETTTDGTPITASARVIIRNADGNVGLGVPAPTYRLQLPVDGAAKPSTNTWTVLSDLRLKRVVGPYMKGLRELMQLEPIRYYYVQPSKDSLFAAEVLAREHIGFAAQAVAGVFPEAVDTAANGYLGLNIHAILIAYLNAIKELKVENDRLKAALYEETQRLHAELEALRRRLEAQEKGHRAP